MINLNNVTNDLNYIKTDNKPPLIIYTDKELSKLDFKQISDEFNSLLEHILGASICPQCGYTSWLTGDIGVCTIHKKGQTKNKIITNFWNLWKQPKKHEEAMKLLLKNPDSITPNLHWKCSTCKSVFTSFVTWNFLPERNCNECGRTVNNKKWLEYGWTYDQTLKKDIATCRDCIKLIKLADPSWNVLSDMEKDWLFTIANEEYENQMFVYKPANPLANWNEFDPIHQFCLKKAYQNTSYKSHIGKKR